MARTPTCRKCRHALAGLPPQCTCPTCGLYNDTDYDDPTTLRGKASAFTRHLARELHDAYPWFAERYLPSTPTVIRASTILSYSAVLCTIGLIIADALTGDIGLLHPRAAAPTPPGLLSDMLANATHLAPLFIAVCVAPAAYQGIVRHRINFTGSATVHGLRARVLGMSALAATLALTALYIWMRCRP